MSKATTFWTAISEDARPSLILVFGEALICHLLSFRSFKSSCQSRISSITNPAWAVRYISGVCASRDLSKVSIDGLSSSQAFQLSCEWHRLSRNLLQHHHFFVDGSCHAAFPVVPQHLPANLPLKVCEAHLYLGSIEALLLSSSKGFDSHTGTGELAMKPSGPIAGLLQD